MEEKIILNTEKIVELRKATGLTMTQVSNGCDFPIGLLSKIEAGKTSSPSVNTVYKLAKFLKVPMEDLLIITSYFKTNEGKQQK